MTPKQRLSAYERALTDYEKAIGEDEKYLFDNKLVTGLCNYFKYGQGIDVNDMEEVLPELYLQKPYSGSGMGYWFEWAELAPRIECLKKAIALTKKTYKL